MKKIVLGVYVALVCVSVNVYSSQRATVDRLQGCKTYIDKLTVRQLEVLARLLGQKIRTAQGWKRCKFEHMRTYAAQRLRMLDFLGYR